MTRIVRDHGVRGPTRGGRDGRTRRRGQEGFVLAAVLLTLVALGALASAGLILTRTDVEIGVNHRTSIEADNVAERGLSRYLADHTAMGGDETYVFGSDTAVVEATRLLETDATYGDTLYRLTSRGIHRTGEDRAVRMLSTLVLDRADRLSIPGALVTGASAEVKGNSEVRGSDDCSDAAVAGVAVAQGGYWLGSEDRVEGSPEVDTSYATPADVVRSTGVRWAGIVQDTLVEPDYWVPAGAWPDFSALPSTDYPVIRITSSPYTLDGGNSGRGTIIAEGELDMQGSFNWDGLILVGGGADVATGNAQVDGTVISGLNVLTGASPDGANMSSSGSTRFQYDSCEIRWAVAAGIRWLAEMPGGRSEVMAP